MSGARSVDAVASAAISLQETLPLGFTITSSSGKPKPRYEDGDWTWRPRSYKDGEDIKLECTNDTTGTERRIAGPETSTIE